MIHSPHRVRNGVRERERERERNDR
jgi:hypothetical protein